MNKNKVTKLNTLEQNFQSNLNKLLRNDQEINVDIHNTVLNIIKKIQEFGDKALLDLVDKYDGIKVDKIEQLKISQKQLKLSYTSLNNNEKQALELAASRIRSFHEHQIPMDLEYQDDVKVDLGLKYPHEFTGEYFKPRSTSTSS